MEDKTFELIEKMYIEFSKKFDKIDQKFDKIDQRFDEIGQKFDKIDQRFDEIDQRFDIVNKKLDEKADKKDIIRLENDLKPKVEALFDGYKQHSDQLDRIEKEVSKHEEVILRRIK